MSGFTKGPWKAIEGTTTGQAVIAPGEPMVRHKVAAVGGPNREANARLIAAAPQLLEDGSTAADMLDMLLKCWVEGREVSDEEGRRATKALMRFNATAAAATGGAA